MTNVFHTAVASVQTKWGRTRLAMVALFFALLLLMVWEFAGSHPPIKKLDVQMVGDDYRFGFRYPGEDLILRTQDDQFGARNLFVPEDAEIQLSLTSRDYIYLLEIPKMNVYEVAAPDLDFQVTFKAPTRGRYLLLGSQMCGYEHAELLGSLMVVSQDEFWRTSRNFSPTPVSADSTL